MAVKDVKKYYIDLINQYVEMKNDITDFEVAFKEGHITEDRLIEVKKDLEVVKDNLDRVSYIMYLLEMPNKKTKKTKYQKQHTKLGQTFILHKADKDSVIRENDSFIKLIKEELESITK